MAPPSQELEPPINPGRFSRAFPCGSVMRLPKYESSRSDPANASVAFFLLRQEMYGVAHTKGRALKDVSDHRSGKPVPESGELRRGPMLLRVSMPRTPDTRIALVVDRRSGCRR